MYFLWIYFLAWWTATLQYVNHRPNKLLAAAVQTYWYQNWIRIKYSPTFLFRPPRPPSLRLHRVVSRSPSFICLFVQALGWRPQHLFWPEGACKQRRPCGPGWHTPTPPKHPVLPPPLAGFNKERGRFGGGTRLPPPTRPPSPPGLMHDLRRSCGAKWIPWHGAHERGSLGFYFFLLTFIHAGRADEAHRRLHKLNVSQHICCRASFSGSFFRCSVILLLYFVSSRLLFYSVRPGNNI